MVCKGQKKSVWFDRRCDSDAVGSRRRGHLPRCFAGRRTDHDVYFIAGSDAHDSAMYAMGGQFLPNVMHIASRVVTSNHHSIFGDHTDFMTCRTTGYAMLMSSSPQEAMDLGAVAHLSAIRAKYAFMHCFDGFRTSHEMQRIEGARL